MGKYSDYNIIPLGDHCAISIVLKELGLRQQSYPFDWVTKKEQVHDTNIMYNVSLIDSLCKTDSVDAIVGTFIGDAFDNKNTNTHSTVWFPHDTENRRTVIEKYKRRFARLKGDLTKKNMFILLTRHYYIDQGIFEKIQEQLLGYNRDSILLFISGKDHPYFSTMNYPNVLFKYIDYDISQFYSYDYSSFRPAIKTYLAELLL